MKTIILKSVILMFSASTAIAGQNLASNTSGCGGSAVITGNSNQIVTIGDGQTITTINGVTTITNNSGAPIQMPSVSSNTSDSVAISDNYEQYVAKIHKQLETLQATYDQKLNEYNNELQLAKDSSTQVTKSMRVSLQKNTVNFVI